jgi:hypothetical protein
MLMHRGTVYNAKEKELQVKELKPYRWRQKKCEFPFT